MVQVLHVCLRSRSTMVHKPMQRTMDRPKLYLVSRNDGNRLNAARGDSKSSPVVHKLPIAPAGEKNSKQSVDRPSARFLAQRKHIWDDESSWDSI